MRQPITVISEPRANLAELVQVAAEHDLLLSDVIVHATYSVDEHDQEQLGLALSVDAELAERRGLGR